MKNTVIRIICLVVALASFGYVGWYFFQMKRTQGNVESLASRVEAPAMKHQPTPVEKPMAKEKPAEEVDWEPVVLSEFEPLLMRNQGIIGWISIAGTEINYPVMKSLYGNGEYYLDHNFDQQEDKNGCLFMDDRCDVIKPSINYLIYGHNMKSGKMFGSLDEYKSEAFWRSHPTVVFNTIYDYGTYTVMAAFESRVYTDTDIGFRYYDFVDPEDEYEFMTGVDNIKALSMYETGVDAEWGDRLLMLSTCDYEQDNGRFVVVCKQTGY
ncbi:MAG: class B sortase [Lachnospiraceae bacterium]|nr:class B sortase [Lachnospiraceae bacterium]